MKNLLPGAGFVMLAPASWALLPPGLTAAIPPFWDAPEPPDAVLFGVPPIPAVLAFLPDFPQQLTMSAIPIDPVITSQRRLAIRKPTFLRFQYSGAVDVTMIRRVEMDTIRSECQSIM